MATLVHNFLAKDKDKKLSLAELYSQFKDWFRDSLPNHTLPIKNEIEEYFELLKNEKTEKNNALGFHPPASTQAPSFPQKTRRTKRPTKT